MSKFKVYHNQNFLDYTFKADEVDSVPMILLDWVADVECVDKEDAFRCTNHIDEEWWNNEEVTVNPDPAVNPPRYRSTSVGDVIFDDAAGKYFICAGIGWKEITLV